MTPCRVFVSGVVLGLLGAFAPAVAQVPPTAPGVVGTDGPGRPTVRAIRLVGPLTIDGRLDDEMYKVVPPAAGFTQQEPREGAPPTEKTDVWVFFDATNIYIAARCWDSQPDRIIANEMRRDGNIMQNDSISVTLDTFQDHRTAYFFQTNPVGGLRDQQVNDERNANIDWNGVWDTKTSLDERGWAAEMVIPFKTLRYRAGGQQQWGINVRRIVRWKNETSFLAPVPAAFGTRGSFAISFSAPLVGLDVPAAARAVELKPYIKSGLASDRRASPVQSNDLSADAGVDLKYGLTKGLVADLTVNTDFAQVEADEQQVNLTRASLFFPEKREFFLEGQGIFGFGGAQQSLPGGGLGLSPVLETGGAPSLTPALFFSRRIGLNDGREVPIRVGGRVAGRAGPFSIGLLNIQAGASKEAAIPATNFSIVRIKRDILRQSSVGFVGTSRSPRVGGEGSNQTFGADATFTFLQNLTITSYYAGSRTPGITRDNRSYLAKVDYAGDRYGVNVEHLSMGEGFKPDVGLIRRESFRRTYGYGRFSPRPRSSSRFRKTTFETTFDYITDRQGHLQSRTAVERLRLDMNGGDQVQVEYRRNYEFLASPFPVATGVRVAPGSYGWQSVNMLYYLGPQRPLSGRVTLNVGGFYGGRLTEVGLTSRLDLGPRLSAEPRLTLNWADIPAGRFHAILLGGRVGFTMTPRLLLTSLFQYNSSTHSLASNIRFRWEYVPGSDLFVVYTDGRNTRFSGFPTLENRSLVLKATRLLRR